MLAMIKKIIDKGSPFSYQEIISQAGKES